MKTEILTIPVGDDAITHAVQQHEIVQESRDYTYHQYPNDPAKLFIIVFTDGSATDTFCRFTARAGWGIFYYNNSPHNAKGGFTGVTQTSYRSELRAVIHVARTCSQSTWIKCDCKAVVDQVNAILNHNIPDYSQLKEGDLWELLAELVANQPADFLRITWIPSHCDENKKKADAMIKAGLITQTEIYGNS